MYIYIFFVNGQAIYITTIIHNRRTQKFAQN